MGHIVTKILCHPHGGGPFCAYDESIRAFANYFSTEDVPPEPGSLGIEHQGVTDVAVLVWRPVVVVIGNPDEDVDISGEYDEYGQPI